MGPPETRNDLTFVGTGRGCVHLKICLGLEPEVEGGFSWSEKKLIGDRQKIDSHSKGMLLGTSPPSKGQCLPGRLGSRTYLIVVADADGRLGGVVKAMSDGAMDLRLKGSPLLLLLGEEVTPMSKTLNQGS